MSTLGDNLLLQWWGQNQCPYAPGMTLWIEADSYGLFTYTNKAPGAQYDLYVNSSRRAGVQDGAIVVPYNGYNMDLRADRNVVGAGSWTVEAVLQPSVNNAVNFIFSQRTSAASEVPAGQMQMICSSRGFYALYAWQPTGVNVAADMSGDAMPVDMTQPQFVACGYDAGTGRIWRRKNGLYAYNDNVEFSCDVSAFALGNAMFSNISYKGKIFSFRVWQRALSDAEIAADYAADKRRFNF